MNIMNIYIHVSMYWKGADNALVKKTLGWTYN